MTGRVALLLSLLLACAAAVAGPKEDALAAYQQFFDAFTTGNQDQVARLFAPDALFYGTRSTGLVTTPEGVHRYFTEALAVPGVSVKATSLEKTALVLSDGVVAIAGKWYSERTTDGKTVATAPSRNTVVMQKRGEQWLIVQFHNSPTPAPTPAPTR